MRMEFVLPLTEGERGAFERAFARDVGEPLGLDWRVWDAPTASASAILVSRDDHCLLDLLWRWRRGELEADVVVVASNHPDLRADVDAFGLPYHHVPVDRDDKARGRGAAARAARAATSTSWCWPATCRSSPASSSTALGVPVINIHHSFLPAFAGAEPYEQAKERGVKLIGATAHYVTEELDDGPIIEQDVIRVSHRDTPAHLARLGADIERTVLARAVRLALRGPRARPRQNHGGVLSVV